MSAPNLTAIDHAKKALAEFFPPDELNFRWKSPADVKDGDKILVRPYLTAFTVQNRLDAALGVNSWSVRYIPAPSGEILCELVAIMGKRRVQRSAFGDSEFRDKHHSPGADNAFVKAAAALGVGRYLHSFPALFSQWDEKRQSIRSDPKIPEMYLPHSHRRAGQPTGDRLAGLLSSCCEREARDVQAALFVLLAEYGYTFSDPVPTVGGMFARFENRHASALMQRLNDWAQEIAGGFVDGPSSPFHKPGQAPAVRPIQPQQKPPAQAPAQPPAQPVTELRNLPKDGAELLSRLSSFDERLAGEKLCVKGAVLAHVLTMGEKHKHPADLVTWNAEAIKRGVRWAMAYEDTLRKAVKTSPAT